MEASSTSAAEGPETAARRPRLAFDLDVDVCVVGAGLAGLTAALEASRLGASVAVLERRQVGWSASGHQLGTVIPGFNLPPGDLIARVGLDDARALWALSKQGVDHVRATASELPGIGQSEGALDVSNVEVGDASIGPLQTLAEASGAPVEVWQAEQVRRVLKTGRYFHGIHHPAAFQVDGRRYVHGLATLAEQAGARIFEDTEVVGIDFSGVRKRIVTPSGRLRAAHIVLAGNVHLGALLPSLSETLVPVWRYAAVTEPLGERLAEAIAFPGSVIDRDGIDQFRIVDGDRLMWASPETTWEARPPRFGAAIRRRIATVFPQLGRVAIAETFGGVNGITVHGMPQVGELRKGLWVASGFGRQGIATSAMAGQLVAQGMLGGDDRWRLFSPFELVWAGGRTGQVAGHLVGLWVRGASAAAGVVARYREGIRTRERRREARRADAGRRPPPRRYPPAENRMPPEPGEASPASDLTSQESDGLRRGPL